MNRQQNNRNVIKFPGGIGLYVVLIMVIMGTIGVMLDFPDQQDVLSYSDVVACFENEQVEAFVIEGTTLTMQLKDKSVLEYELPSLDVFYYDLGETIAYQRSVGIIQMQDFQVEEISWFSAFLPYIILAALLAAFWFFVVNKQDGGARGAMNFGKSRAKLATSDMMKVLFKDVAGAEEEKAELVDRISDARGRLTFRKSSSFSKTLKNSWAWGPGYQRACFWSALREQVRPL